MINPAFADSDNDDQTIKNVKDYLYNYNDFGSFDIINLYPVRMPNPKLLRELNNKTKKEKEKYHEFVKKYLTEKCDKQYKNRIIIASWGSDEQDNNKAKELFSDTNIKFYCYGLTKKGCPKHFGSQSYNNFDKFRYPFPYMKISVWNRNDILSEYDKQRLSEATEIKKWFNKAKTHIKSDMFEIMPQILEDVFPD